MKAKKWVTFITCGVSLLSLICSIIADCKCIDLMYDISMAIFGSALLGFIMSLIEYFAERRKAMEEFLKAAYRIFVQFRRLKYIDIDEPKELILDCIAEEQHNDYCSSFEEVTAKVLNLTVKHTKRTEYIEWMENNEVMSFEEDDDKDAILLEIYNQRIENYKKTFRSRIKMYLDASKMDLEELSNSYGNLDFLFGNGSVRKAAYNSIYSKLQNYRNKILLESFHFNLLGDGGGNFAVCVGKLFELNEFFFMIKEESNRILVYQYLLDEVSDKIEEFRSKTYFKKTVEYEKKTPVLSKQKNKQEIAEEKGAF